MIASDYSSTHHTWTDEWGEGTWSCGTITAVASAEPYEIYELDEITIISFVYERPKQEYVPDSIQPKEQREAWKQNKARAPPDIKPKGSVPLPDT